MLMPRVSPDAYQPAVTARVGVATIKGHHNADTEGLIYHDTVEYDFYFIDSNGVSFVIESVKPTNKWFPGSTVRCDPAPPGSEWPCQITTTRLLLWVYETPAVGPCTTGNKMPNPPVIVMPLPGQGRTEPIIGVPI